MLITGHRDECQLYKKTHVFNPFKVWLEDFIAIFHTQTIYVVPLATTFSIIHSLRITNVWKSISYFCQHTPNKQVCHTSHICNNQRFCKANQSIFKILQSKERAWYVHHHMARVQGHKTASCVRHYVLFYLLPLFPFLLFHFLTPCAVYCGPNSEPLVLSSPRPSSFGPPRCPIITT